MTTEYDLDGRLARLRAEWPAGSMVNDVMARLGPPVPRSSRRARRLLTGLASGLVAAAVLAWLIIASQPKTLMAAVRDGLERAQSAHIVITFGDGRDKAQRSEIWYRRGEGLRVEEPGQVIIEDGKTQWSWQTGADAGEPRVLRQRSPGFFLTMLPEMIALPDMPADWKRVRAPELDRIVDGHACQCFTVTPSWGDPQSQSKSQAADRQAHRALVVADADGRIHEISVQQHQEGKSWQQERLIQISYDVSIPADKLAARLPAGAQVVDRDAAFDSLYPRDRALHQVELGGLILAVHDVQPLKDREGVYVVSSVRGTPKFLKEYPPRRRPVNPETVMLDVAFQPGSNGNWSGKYDRIVMGSAARDGVEFSWWLIVPRHYFRIKDGRRVYEPENDKSWTPDEPGRLDSAPGKVQVPLSATYWDEKHRDARGIPQSVSTWAEIPLPADRPPTTLDDVAAHARRDLLMMDVIAGAGLLGVAADTKGDPKSLRPLSHFSASKISDTDFASAVRRGLDDLRDLDELLAPRPEEMLAPPGRHGHEH